MAKGISVPVVQSGLENSIAQGVKNVGKINIPATIDPSAFKNLAQPLGRVSGLATEFEKSIAASNARVLAFGASVGIINGVQNAFSDLVKTGIDVQKTLTDIAAISGKSGQELSKFGDALFEVAKNTSQSFKTASQAALEFSRQGLSTEQTLKRTNDALTLTRFTSLSAAEAVDVLTAAANSFSETGITTAEIINKLVAVDTKFAVSAEDLANGLARAGSIAQEVGVNFDQLNAAITVAQERTARGGAVIGNALKTIFTRIRSNDTINALQEIGIFSRDANGALKPVVSILEEVAKKVQTLGGTKKIEVLEAIASKYNINILSALIDDLNNANSKFSEVVGISAGASNEAYLRQIELNKTLSAQINNTSVSVTQLFNKLAEIGVTENLGNLLKFVNSLLDGFNRLLDSEGLGGNVARGIIKGLSDIFFTIGLPIIGAIFVKLTRDIAKFGVESLQTILGINQQVKERQALEQAVVNTLLRDQEVMATILSLSNDRTRQEQYLLGIYNSQLAALEKVQVIAKSVTPALMAGGLSATSGQIKKKAAGGYLPAQEAADIRRGVGGANSSARVVSIPNFAFGGGKRGTMIANTSEYMVPNFANGGSAIFNRDMVRAYGLPAGAKKISAAGGYVPNFAKYGQYAALVGQKKPTSTENRFVSKDPTTNKINVDSQQITKDQIPISFDVYGIPDRSDAEIENVKSDLSEFGKNQAVRLAQQMTGNAIPSDLVQAKLAATFNPGSLGSFAGTIFEASVGSLLSDKSFKDYAEQAVTSTFDLNVANNPKLKKTFEIDQAVQALEVKGSYTKPLMDSVAKKIYQVVEGQREAFSKQKIGDQEAKNLGIGRPYSNLNKLEVIETVGGNQQIKKFNSQKELEVYIANKYTKSFGESLVPGSGSWTNAFLSRGRGAFRGATGYIPNFANGGPLEEAINREIAAGLNPSQIRVTQDGRLKNSKNPEGLAVINTRDEPNGKIPNFAAELVKNDKGVYLRAGTNQPASKREIAAFETEESAIASGAASRISDRPRQSENTGTKDKGNADKAFQQFFLLQSAVVGVTGAMQSLTEQGSTASKALATTGGVLSTAVSGFSAFSAGMGPVGIGLSVLATGFATLGPVVIEYVNSLETEKERVIKALAELGAEARKTGQAVSPEKFLAAFEKAQKQIKQQTESRTFAREVQSQLAARSETGVVAEADINSLIAALQAAKITQTEDVGKFLDRFTKERSMNATERLYQGIQSIPSDGPSFGGEERNPLRKVKSVDASAAIEDARLQVLEEAKRRENEIAQTRTQAELDRSKVLRDTVLFENDQIIKKLSIEREIFNIEQSITQLFFDRNLAAEQRLSILEKEKGSMTEAAYLAKKYEIDRGKIADTQAKKQQEAALSLKKSFSGLEGGLGKILGQFDPEQLIGIASELSLDQFGKDQGRGAISKMENIALGSLMTGGEQIDLSNLESLNTLSQQQRETIVRATEEYSKAISTAGVDRAQAEAALKQAFDNTLTESQKLGIEINNARLALSGQGKYSEMLQQAQQNLELSYLNLQVKNKIELESADKIIDSRIKVAEENLKHARDMRAATPIEKRAIADAAELNQQTDERIDILKREAINSDLRIKTGRDLLNAETDKLEAENDAYKKLSMSEIVNEQLRNARAKLVESERKAEEQNQVAIKMVKQNFDADLAAVDRKIALAKVYNEQIDQAQTNLKVEKDLQLEGANLLTARRQAIAQFNKIDLGVQNFEQGFGTSQITDITKILTEGRGYSEMGIGAGTLETQARANVAQQRIGGRGIEKISSAELYSINTGRGNTIAQNASIAGGGLLDQAQTFQSIIGTQAPKMFADKMAEAMQATLNSADNLGDALSGIAQSFLSEMQRAFLQSASQNIVGAIMPKMAKGGLVNGGSGYKDDVPAMLMGGEFVMRKSAVQKYGAENLKKMNNGGIFLPGVRGGGAISGEEALRAFATQTTTSGATDILMGGRSAAYANLEDQSARLSKFALLGDDTINQEIRNAQEQALNAIAKKEEYNQQKKEQRKQLQKQLIGTIASAALSYGIGSLARGAVGAAGAAGAAKAGTTGLGLLQTPTFLTGAKAFDLPPGLGKAYGGMIRRYASGGPVDDIPALLMGGEYVMNRQSSSKYGKRLLDSMNQGRMPRFADGGEVGGSTTSATESDAKMMGDVSININVSGGTSQTETQGNTSQGGVDYKKMSERIKAVVIETINEEKRLGGSLRSR